MSSREPMKPSPRNASEAAASIASASARASSSSSGGGLGGVPPPMGYVTRNGETFGDGFPVVGVLSLKNQWPDLALKNPRNLGRSRDSCFVNRKFSRIEINHAHLSYARPGLELFGRALIGKPVKITSSARFPFSSGPRTRIKSSTCTYFANSSSFAFFASSAASTGGRVGEKGTGDFGPFFFFPRRRFGDFFSSAAGAGAGAVVSFGPPFTAGVVFVRRRTGAGAAAAPPAALRGRLRLLFEPLRTSLTEGEEMGLSGGAGAGRLGAGGAASLALRLRVRRATESAGGAWASARASGAIGAAWCFRWPSRGLA